VLAEVRELEAWLLTLLSAPIPVPGKTRVLLEVAIIYLIYRISSNKRTCPSIFSTMFFGKHC
jgi:hypothetical protein